MDGESSTDVSVKVTVALTDVQRSALLEIAARLPGARPPTGSGVQDRELKQLVERLARAATEEYIDQATGRATATTLVQAREARLGYVVKHLLEDVWPSERVVAELFGLTASEARSLLGHTLAHHRERMEPVIKRAARSALEFAVQVEKPKGFWISCDLATYHYLVEVLNSTKEAHDESIGRLTHRMDVVGQYNVPADAYELLCKELGAECNGDKS